MSSWRTKRGKIEKQQHTEMPRRHHYHAFERIKENRECRWREKNQLIWRVRWRNFIIICSREMCRRVVYVRFFDFMRIALLMHWAMWRLNEAGAHHMRGCLKKYEWYKRRRACFECIPCPLKCYMGYWADYSTIVSAFSSLSVAEPIARLYFHNKKIWTK